MNVFDDLQERLRSRSAQVGVIGLGYVGLPLAMRFAEVGLKVVGFDIDDQKVRQLREGESYIRSIDARRIAASLENGAEFTTGFSRVNELDAVIICVPTPLGKHGEPDLSYVAGTMADIVPHISRGTIVSLESTTYPGTTEEIVIKSLESAGHRIGEDVLVVYSPEREDPGNESFGTSNTPKICGGATARCLELGCELYGLAVSEVVPVSSLKVAEMTKLLENIYRAVNIGLVNEMKIVADRMDIDIYEVINAAATKPFGFTPFYPGPGLGGHCIPIDPFYLTWRAREFGIETRFIELAGIVNSSMPNWIVSKAVEALNSIEKPVKNSSILVLGVAYKKNVNDLRESPALKIMDMLLANGAKVSYSDPYVPRIPNLRDYCFDLASVEVDESSLAGFDLVILVTDHDCWDYGMIVANSTLLLDTRGRLREFVSEKIIRA